MTQRLGWNAVEQGCAKALEHAGEEAARARQQVLEKEAECGDLRAKLEASRNKLEVCCVKVVVVVAAAAAAATAAEW